MDIKKLDLKLLENLSNAFGPSGHEFEIQKMVLDHGKQFADEVLFDKTGCVIFKKGSEGPKLMFTGHIDEIGYMVKHIEPNGFLKISALGGVIPIKLIGHQIIIRPFKEGEMVIGIVTDGSLAGKIKKEVPSLDDLFVDIGCESEKEVKELGIRVGDPGIPYAFFRTMTRVRSVKKSDSEENSSEKEERHLAVAKSFDDRIGVFIVLEILRRISEESINHPNILYGVSTTQEEVGTRGAHTSSALIQPDIGFSIDVTICGRVPGAMNINQKMGKGVTIGVYDTHMVPNPKFRKFVVELAEKLRIPHQEGFLHRGGTDAGEIHLSGIGAPSLFFGIPSRYVHSHHALLDLEDVESCIQLMIEVIKKLDSQTVATFTRI